MSFLRQNGSIPWKTIVVVVPEIAGNSGQQLQIPDKHVRISHRLTQINLRINHRLGELKKSGKIGKKMVKYARGCFNLLHDGKWTAQNNLKTVGYFFPLNEEQLMDAESAGN